MFSRSFVASICGGVLIAAASLALISCHNGLYYAYKFPANTFAGRPVPPSKLANRVMVSYTTGISGGLQMLDGLRDLRMRIDNLVLSYPVAGYSANNPTRIFNFPEQITGFVFSASDGTVIQIDYGKETGSGIAASFSKSADVAIPPGFKHFYGANPDTGQLVVIDKAAGRTVALNIPNVYKVFVNQGDTVVLAMVRNSNTLYRLVNLNVDPANPQSAIPGAIDCQPQILPQWCAVPVIDNNPTTFDRPVGAYFSLDGSTAYILNCGPECGGATAGLTVIPQAPLNIYNNGDDAAAPLAPGGSEFVPVPGGVTTALADGTTLYLAGQAYETDPSNASVSYFAGHLSTMDLASNTITHQYDIADGYHNKLLFADDNTLWIGGTGCNNGRQFHAGQNYNCLTRFDLGAKTASIVPNVVPGSVPVPFPNANQDPYYYGDLTGLCWVENLHKVYTAYGGQVHAFNTADGSEIDNQYITIGATALDVAYMDATTNEAN
ncbi:MAG: hypothetical protein FWD64_01900 [Acidobacteriaceae bacterium]|nr:hypothetical protein [Acidobacteriaceae bacterium]